MEYKYTVSNSKWEKWILFLHKGTLGWVHLGNIDFIWKYQQHEKSCRWTTTSIEMKIMLAKVNPIQERPKAAKIIHFYKHENHFMKMEYKFSKVIWIFDKVLMKQSRLVKKENLTGNHFRNHSFNFLKIEYEYAENGYKFKNLTNWGKGTWTFVSSVFKEAF